MAGDNSLDQLREFFKEDSRTFRDGPLQNFFLLRKWMVLVIVALALLRGEWLDYLASVVPLLALDKAPVDGIRFATTLFGIYLLVHVLILSIQQIIVYPVDLSERVESHGEKTISKARARRDDYERELIDKIWRDQSDATAADQDVRSTPPPRTLLPSDLEEYKRAYPRQISELGDMIDHVDDLERSFKLRRWWIGCGEVARDIVRVLPISFALLISILVHGWWSRPTVTDHPPALHAPTQTMHR